MSLLLNIDTALDTAIISIAASGKVLGELLNSEQRDHGAFLQPAIQSLLEKTGVDITDIDAVAVSAGPGSYTGLRVGMASAKGLCVALNKPLIALGTLEIMASNAILHLPPSFETANLLYCPMIDARRMEVFTAIYDKNLNNLLVPDALIITDDAYGKWLLKNKICFFGNGSSKLLGVVNSSNAIFETFPNNSLAMSKLSFEKYKIGSFAGLAYVEPLYIKPFFSGQASR